MTDTGGRGLTRRQMIGRGGVLAGALGVGPAGLLTPPAAAAAAALPGDLQRRYVALVEAVGAAPGSRVVADEAETAAARLAEMTDDLGPEETRRVERVLDAIETAAGEGGFHQRSVRDRLSLLRSWQNGTDQRERWMASSAAQLAAQPFDPYPPDFPPAPVILGVDR